MNVFQRQHGHNSLQSQVLTKELEKSLQLPSPQLPTLGMRGLEGHEAGLGLLVAALPLSDPKIKPKEISKNQ